MLPDANPRNQPRRIRSGGQNWRGDRTIDLHIAGDAGGDGEQREPVAEPRDADLRAVHAVWRLHVAADPRDEAQDAGRAGRRERGQPRLRAAFRRALLAAHLRRNQRGAQALSEEE